MGIDVIGAGFGRTGTLSLKLALEQLGFDKCYHMMELFGNREHVDLWRAAGRGEPVDWRALFRGYRASVDWPACTFWEAQLAAFPQARVVLSERDPGRWYESVMNTIYPSSVAARDSGDPAMQPWVQMAFELIWDGTFDGRIEDRAHAIAVYRAHNDHVKRQVPADRLLVFEASQGWESLCRFLGRDVPDAPYPRVNTTEEFQARQAPPPR
ncbi:MAG: sulfotransferase [Pseudomonadales bacterium]